MSDKQIPASIDDLQSLLAREFYVADRGLATSIYLALTLGRPLLLEGEAGVGKTEVAKVLARGLGTELIRLQCYEGLDVSHAVYEWNYARQLLEIRMREVGGDADREQLAADLFSPDFLIKRPLLRALEAERAPVLLIDELDRADEEFEGYLLELLSDYQITVPELGTVKAVTAPIVVITSNRTRELHDALRSAELYKVSGISETLDWVTALVALDRTELDADTVDQTLGLVLKTQEDLDAIRGKRARALVEQSLAPTEA